ncbi:MAG: hypothetical protein C0180_00335 [Aciduliprofundum sp.]|nr:MAG: hypothetical protein C0180_00335 [Aciduliprofundum sp.]
MQLCEYAIGLTAMLFWMPYGKPKHSIQPNTNTISIYKYYGSDKNEKIEVISYIILKIIYRNGSTEKREFSGIFYNLHIKNSKINAPDIAIELHGKISMHKFFVIWI